MFPHYLGDFKSLRNVLENRKTKWQKSLQVTIHMLRSEIVGSVKKWNKEEELHEQTRVKSHKLDLSLPTTS